MEKLVDRKNLSSAYAGKKVFVTGHTGFKGSWLVCLLNHLGAIVKGYALEPEYEQPLYKFTFKLKNTESIIDDIRNKGKLISEIKNFQPDFIFHLAAQPLVRKSYQFPAETFNINVIGTANLLESIIQLENKCSVVVVTTDKVYQNKESDILYEELDQLGGYDPYSASKACTELVVESFRKSFFNTTSWNKHHKGLASARAGNVIGGSDWSEDRLMPDIIKALKHERIIEIRNPQAVRPWQHVLEPLTGYLILGVQLEKRPSTYSKAFNFGPLPEDHLTVKELVQHTIAVWGNGEWKDSSDAAQPYEAGILKLNITQAINELGWKPKLNAYQSIKWAVDWYKKAESNPLKYTINQIEEYLEL